MHTLNKEINFSSQRVSKLSENIEGNSSVDVKKFMQDPDTALLNETMSPMMKMPDVDRANQTTRHQNPSGKLI